jgi:hypothetical protein
MTAMSCGTGLWPVKDTPARGRCHKSVQARRLLTATSMTQTEPLPLTGGILIPKDQPPDARFHLNNLRLLARLLDSAIAVPGTRFRIGLDPILDIIPGIGDAAGAVIGSYILISAARLGIPRSVLARMLLNIGIDAAVGAAPFVGPFLDAAYRSNTRNIALLERAMAEPRATRRASRWTLIGLAAGVVAIIGAGLVLSLWVVKLIWTHIV